MAKVTSQHLTGLEIKIIFFLLENSAEQFAIREIARKTKIDYKLIHSAVQKLAQKGIIFKKRQANVDLCSLNLKSDLSSIQYVEMLKAKDFFVKHSDLRLFFNSVKEKVRTPFYILAIFGSFAKQSETKASDVDLLIVASTREIADEIERVVNNESVFLKRKIQTVVLSEKEFLVNLSSRKLNVVMEAFKNHVLIVGVESFYNAVRQTI